MTKERKKRFYPKRGVTVVDDYVVPYKPVSVGRTPKDDSQWTDEAIKGISEGIYRTPNHAASSIARRNGGPYFNANKNRIAGKIRTILRNRQT